MILSIKKAGSPVNGPHLPSVPDPESEDAAFGSQMHREVARSIKSEVQLHGVQSGNYISAGDVEQYLTGKGVVSFGNEQLLMQVSASYPASKPKMKGTRVQAFKIVTIDAGKLISRLIEDAVCFGDFVGFNKHSINAAVVASAIKMTDSV